MFDNAVVELLLYIYRNGGVIENFREIMTKLEYSSSRLDRARRVLKNYDLIEEELLRGSPVILRMTLLDKGKTIAKHIIEIKKILEQ